MQRVVVRALGDDPDVEALPLVGDGGWVGGGGGVVVVEVDFPRGAGQDRRDGEGVV